MGEWRACRQNNQPRNESARGAAQGWRGAREPREGQRGAKNTRPEIGGDGGLPGEEERAWKRPRWRLSACRARARNFNDETIGSTDSNGETAGGCARAAPTIARFLI